MNLVDIASGRGLNILTVQPGSMDAGHLCEHFFKTSLSPTPTSKSSFPLQQTYRTSVCNFSLLNRHQVRRWFFSLQIIKIMQVEMVNVAAIVRLGRLGSDSNAICVMVHKRHMV
jgi:hypothetical protein